MKLAASFLLVATSLAIGLLFLVRPVDGTWSVVAADRATGQVGGSGATCRTGSSGLELSDEMRLVADRGVVVGQAYAGEGNNNRDQDNAETAMQQDPPNELTAGQIVSITQSYVGLGHQWGAAKLNGNAAGYTGPNCDTVAVDEQGHVGGDYTYSVQGNRLTSDKVVKNAKKEFKKKGGKGGKGGKKKCDELVDRLIRAVEAGGKDGEGDDRCRQTLPGTTYSVPPFGVPATAAHIKVVDQDGNDVYSDEVSFGEAAGNDALALLRSNYDSWRANNDCEKRPKGSDRAYDPLPKKGSKELLGSGIIALLGLGAIALGRKRRVFTEGTFVDSFLKQTPVPETQLTTPYALERAVQA